MSQRAEARRARRVATCLRIARWSAIMVGAVVVGWGAMMGVKHSGPALNRLLEVKQLTVEGAYHVTQQEVIDLAGVKPGIPLHHIVPAIVKQQVESHPWVKEAVVSRVPLHELRIFVIERKPAAIIRTGTENFLSDEEGHVLARLGQTDDDTLPMVTGIDPKQLLRGDDGVQRAIMSGIELAKLVGHTYEGRLQVNAANPLNLVASVRGVHFQFGEEPVSAQWERFRRVKPSLKTLNFDGQGRGANEVDLRFENRIIVRERG